ncbi:hypothetical protein QTP88_001203 [Uroleucon formosanum]
MAGKRKKDEITKSSLFSYFKKQNRDDAHLNQKKVINDSGPRDGTAETQINVLSGDQPSCSTSKEVEIIDNEWETNFRSNDIGLFANRILTDADKKIVLRNLWVPNVNYKFLLLEKYKARGLKYQHKWFTEFNWLAYSEIKQGVFCKYCLLFAKHGGVGSQPLGQLVSNAFTNWKKAKETFRNHSQLKYHLSSKLDADHFLSILDHKQVSIVDKIETNRTEQIKLNRSHLIPIIECVVLCGQQEIALRGHRDSGKINEFENQGNFRAILKYKSHGDIFLNNILEEGNGYKYISSKIQNEIVCICDQLILKEIVEKVDAAEGFAVLADKTTDIATKEQLTLCVRFIDCNNKINESFLKFVIIHSLTGTHLASAIINGLKSCGINFEHLIGQGYNGASNMSGKYKGFQVIVRAEYPKPIYVHCVPHTLNLSVSNASNIQPIRNYLDIIEKLYDFFNTSKRNNVLLNCIENGNETPSAKSLKRLCATRWIQRYDTVSDFMELFPYVIDALYNISNCHDSSATDASLLSKSIDSEFIISLKVVKQLQKIRIDLKEAVELSNDTVKHLESIRANAEKKFHKLFVQAEDCLFSKHELTAKEDNKFTELIRFYSPMVSNDSLVLVELELWQSKIQRCEKIPNTGLEALDICNKDIYPNMYVLLKVLCTLPVSASSPERMFLTLKRVKTYLRNTMSEV